VNPHNPSLDWFTEQERLALEQKWKQGVMRDYLARILDFVAAHRDEIILTAGADIRPAALLAATQRVIDAHRTLDMRAELSRQRQKIAEHIWHAGERGAHDPNQLADEWIAIYAALWREWLVKKYLYTAERYGPAIVGMLVFPRETLRAA
jgi:hypothetical protein